MDQLVIAGSIWVRLAGIWGAIGVAFGAYNAHVIQEKTHLTPKQKDIFSRANKYHLLHALALLATPLSAHPNVSGTLLLSGALVFCCTCYLHVLFNNKTITRFTPLGGMTLIIGWLSLAFN